MNAADPIGWGPLLRLAFGAGLLALLLGAGRVLQLVPQRRSRRELIARWSPVLGLVAVLAYLTFAARVLFGARPDALQLALGLLLLGFAGATWFAIRDLVAGVFIKTGRLCRVGDHVQIGALRGRVARMGYRVIALETGRGEEVFVPYSELSRQALLRTPTLEGAALHVFRLRAPEHVPEAEVRRRVRHAALACHFASAVRPPEIALVEPHTFEVIVYAVGADHTLEVQAAVEAALSQPPPDSPPT